MRANPVRWACRRNDWLSTPFSTWGTALTGNIFLTPPHHPHLQLHPPLLFVDSWGHFTLPGSPPHCQHPFLTEAGVAFLFDLSTVVVACRPCTRAGQGLTLLESILCLSTASRCLHILTVLPLDHEVVHYMWDVAGFLLELTPFFGPQSLPARGRCSTIINL